MNRRFFLQAMLMAGAVPAAMASTAKPSIEVFKSATCGCCTQWVDHLAANGFTVKAHNVNDLDARRARLRVPQAMAGCHTAVIAGYAIEGHVPAAEIKRLLAERPKALGLSVPGMPMGSPGMEGPTSEAYDVVLFQADGSSKVYRHYPAAKKA